MGRAGRRPVARAARGARGAVAAHGDRSSSIGRAGQRGEAPFEIGIGVNTGPAVAGNSGSSTRLNYTVLGASVNAAMRLCSEAQASEILIGEQTFAQVRDHVAATRQPPRVVKGFSTPVAPYRVEGLRDTHAERGGRARRSGPRCWWPVCWQHRRHLLPHRGSIWPTLEELGVRYVSPDGLVQVKPSVRVDVDGFFPQDAPAWHLEDTSPFVAGRASLFVDLFVGRRLYVSTELRLDRGQPARSGPLMGHVQQAFVRFTPAPGTNVHVQGGKFVSPFGGYPGRAHTSADPFIRPPLAYDFRTVMQPVEVPAAPDGVFTWKNRPPFRAAGLPIVWAVPYPVGLTVTAGKGPISGTGRRDDDGAVGRAVGLEHVRHRATRQDRSAVGQVRYRVSPALQRGRVVHERAVHAVVGHRSGHGRRRCPGRIRRPTASTRRSRAVSWTSVASCCSIAGRSSARRATPRDVSYYVEGQTRIAAGLFVAARYNAIHFRDLPRSNGQPDRWDYDMRRWQFGAGYRLGRSSEIRGEYMINTTVDQRRPARQPALAAVVVHLLIRDSGFGNREPATGPGEVESGCLR